MGHSLEIESDFEKPSFISFTIASGTKPNISWTIFRGGKIGYWNVQDIGQEIFNVSSTIFPLEKSHLGQYSVRVRNKIGGIDLNIELVGKISIYYSASSKDFISYQRYIYQAYDLKRQTRVLSTFTNMNNFK